ncbi:hypothetical protein [Kitasatospora sp. NPDC097691]|uniref:hypothetical protein n=1 Tax=Kitasatospora sp. NPDC097691 TaxID=3157231 RepID=UPI0033167902
MEEMGDEGERATFERLAQQVRDELAAAGLPVVANDLAPELAPEPAVGAEVCIEWLNRVFPDMEPEVVVSWRVGPQLRRNVMEDAMQRRVATAAIRQSGEVEAAMAGAVIAILSAAGFTARDHDNDLSPFEVQVLAGPEPGRRPAWAFPEEDLTAPAGPAAG